MLTTKSLLALTHPSAAAPIVVVRPNKAFDDKYDLKMRPPHDGHMTSKSTKTSKATTPNHSNAQCGVFEEQRAKSGTSSCTPSALTQLVAKHVVLAQQLGLLPSSTEQHRPTQQPSTLKKQRGAAHMTMPYTVTTATTHSQCAEPPSSSASLEASQPQASCTRTFSLHIQSSRCRNCGRATSDSHDAIWSCIRDIAH